MDKFIIGYLIIELIFSVYMLLYLIKKSIPKLIDNDLDISKVSFSARNITKEDLK